MFSMFGSGKKEKPKLELSDSGGETNSDDEGSYTPSMVAADARYGPFYTQATDEEQRAQIVRVARQERKLIRLTEALKLEIPTAQVLPHLVEESPETNQEESPEINPEESPETNPETNPDDHLQTGIKIQINPPSLHPSESGSTGPTGGAMGGVDPNPIQLDRIPTPEGTIDTVASDAQENVERLEQDLQIMQRKLAEARKQADRKKFAGHFGSLEVDRIPLPGGQGYMSVPGDKKEPQMSNQKTPSEIGSEAQHKIDKAALGRAITSAKGLITRIVNEVRSKCYNRTVMEAAHGKLDEYFERFRDAQAALYTQEVTPRKQKKMQEDFLHYEKLVIDTKNWVSQQLDLLTSKAAKTGARDKMKTPPKSDQPKQDKKPSDPSRKDKDKHTSFAPPPQDWRKKAQEESTLYRQNPLPVPGLPSQNIRNEVPLGRPLPTFAAADISGGYYQGGFYPPPAPPPATAPPPTVMPPPTSGPLPTSGPPPTYAPPPMFAPPPQPAEQQHGTRPGFVTVTNEEYQEWQDWLRTGGCNSRPPPPPTHTPSNPTRRPGVTTPKYTPPGVVNWAATRGYNEKPERPIVKIEPKPFDGTDATDPWWRWKQNFNAVIGSRNHDDSVKVFNLLQLLKGEPLAIAESLSMGDYNTDTYITIWNTLEDNYGGLDRVRNAMVKRIKGFQKIKKFDKDNTQKLENLLMVVYNQFKDEQGVIDHGGVLNDSVKDLLPQHELTRYFRKIAEQGLEDTFLSLKKFVETERVAYKLADISSSSTGQRSFVTRSEEVQPQPSAPEEYETEQDYYQTNAAFIPNPNYKPKYSPNSTYAKPKPDGETKPTIHGPNSSSSPSNLVKKVCSCCDKDHLLYQCPQFKMLTVTEKFKHIFASKSCIHCLNVGHLLKDCTFYPERTCGIEGCTDKHHRQLHNYPDSKGRTLLTVEEFIHQQVLMSFQTCHTQNEDEYIAIRTTTAIVSHGGKQKRVVIAMDPCSNSTNIDSDFAKEMGLTVEEEGIIRNINFLESSAQVHSDLVSFMLSPLDKSATFKVKAYTVKNLITGTPVVDWKQVAETYPHLKKAQIPDTQDTDRVHILLGTDYAHLNGVIEGVFGKDFEPIAELTRLGWAFSGRVKTKQILPSWISQFGNVANSVFFSYMGRNVAPWVQSKPRLAQNFSAINGKADPILDKRKQATIHGLTLETITEECETHSSTSDIPTVLESGKLDGTHTSTDADLACVAACDNNPGLLTYLNLAPNVNTEEEKLHALDELIRKSWEVEALGLVERVPRISNNHHGNCSENWTKQEKIAAEKMNIKYLPEMQQFQMSIPWKDNPPNFIRSNRAAVKRRQDGVCQRLGNKIGDAQKIFDGYLEKGYIRKLDKHEIYEDNVFYLPFFTVVKEESTTPVRIVWDCAAKFDGKSLNSEIMPTPNCLQPLFKVLMRVRKFPFVVMSDISEMFLKVRLDPKDRRYHRFTFNGEDYEWLVMLFGNRSSPDGSQMVIQENCRLHGAELPEAVETVNHSCYMDDGADSRETEEIALKLALQLIELFKRCGMPVHKFFSNSPLVCQTLDKKVLAKQITFDSEADTVWESGKVLGMAYSVEEGDVFTFSSKFRNVADISDVKEGQWTKRNICSASAAIFDPLGLISPFVVRARVIMQEIWRLKINWDTILPENIQAIWMQWLNQVFTIPDIKIRRWSGITTKTTRYQIHTFCDASEEGYCVAVYIRIKDGSKITTNLLTAKSRVSPLKAESISRQELVGCVLAVRLTAAVQETYPANVENTFYWTDSQVCLCWINYTAKSFKAYVAHRVGEIHTHTEPRQWLHVPTAENPADVGTRTISALDLKSCDLWWHGPSFLKLPVHQWPKTKVIEKLETSELKETIFMTTEPFTKAPIFGLLKHLHPQHFSSGNLYSGYNRCVRSWSIVLKAVMKFKHLLIFKTKKEERFACNSRANLTPTELQSGRRFLIKQSQVEFFELEIKLMSKDYLPLSQVSQGLKSDILQFNPFLDEFGVMRSKSRLANLGQDYEITHPVILHRQSAFTKLLVGDLHCQFEHPVSFSAMKAAIRKHYAILGIGTLCGQIKSSCPQCRKLLAGPFVQQMAPLSERRVGTKLKAFEHVGIDFAGPFELKVGRAKARKKVWILVITCMTIRAIHLEVTGGLDTTHVVNALSRFADVRGVPTSITSDNQTSFHKADDELRTWYASIDWKKVERQTSFGYRPFSDGIEWHFNPPTASHFGGVFEIMVKAMKRALKTTIGRADLDEEEFRTTVSKMAHLLNCRPIQVVSDLRDYEVLTPNHFLLPDLAGTVFPPEVKEEDRLKLSTRLKHQIMIQQHVWRRFQEEVVPMLGPRKKWCRETPNLHENDVVMEMDDNQPRGAWRLLRVTKIIPGSDGLIRKVEVINSTGKTYLRPIHKLIPVARE